MKNMNAKLPENLESIGVKDLVEGETMYTLPWGMYADHNGDLWLNGNYPIIPNPRGTFTLKVTKLHGKYIVDVSLCKNRTWTLGGGQFVGNYTPLPVSELLGA